MYVPRSRGSSRWMLLIIALAVLAIAGARLLPDLGGSTTTANGEITQVVPGTVPVQVVRVIDGDTIDVRSGGEELRVRLFGIDAPERGEPCAEEATDRLVELAGGVVQLLPDERIEDRFGRQLRYVYAADGTFIDEAMIAEGFAVAWRDDGAFRDDLVTVEEQARAAGTGCLWGD
jgi:micrococcal nuclease